MPTRLVQLTDNGPRLVSTADLAYRPLYAALSHCWGDQQFLKLEKGNMEAFFRSIPQDQLPRTFSDALTVVRSLHLDSIWIDSLCIVQDDDDDWQSEGIQMSAVYGGSVVNITASSAESTRQGFLSKPISTIDGVRARVTISGTHGDRNAVLQFEHRRLYELVVRESHLATRAWAFQEKILSPRTIHFGSRGLFWECSSKMANNDLPEQLLVPLMLDSPDPGLLRPFKDSNLPEMGWDSAVRFYSKTNMTSAYDKLPAISGVSQHVQEQSGNSYLAGLWMDSTIEQQLCWYTGVPNSSSIRTIPHLPSRAPSWSWASVDERVYFCNSGPYLHVTAKYAHVLSAWTTLRHFQSPFGQVTAGQVSIACSTMLIGRFGGRNTVVIESEDGEFTLPGHRDNSRHIHADADDELHLLPLLDLGDLYGFRGILLRKTGLAVGEFTRVGSFKQLARESTAHPERIRLLRDLGRFGRVIARAACAEAIENPDHPSESFLITLV